MARMNAVAHTSTETTTKNTARPPQMGCTTDFACYLTYLVHLMSHATTMTINMHLGVLLRCLLAASNPVHNWLDVMNAHFPRTRVLSMIGGNWCHDHDGVPVCEWASHNTCKIIHRTTISLDANSCKFPQNSNHTIIYEDRGLIHGYICVNESKACGISLNDHNL